MNSGTISTYGLYIFIGALSLALLVFAPVLSDSLVALTDLRVAFVLLSATLYATASNSSSSALQTPHTTNTLTSSQSGASLGLFLFVDPSILSELANVMDILLTL